MKRKDYKNYVWYDLTDEEYWVDDAEEFPGCYTIVFSRDWNTPKTKDDCYIGWGTMAKYEGYKFMIIEKPIDF